jgi:hypothetical protein
MNIVWADKTIFLPLRNNKLCRESLRKVLEVLYIVKMFFEISKSFYWKEKTKKGKVFMCYPSDA